nr:hypothetical protein [Tanacetum cinerariifolium]
DLHLNLSVIEVLAHAPMYNAILDKYVESLELGKNGIAFIQSEMPKKIKDLGLFILPCRLRNSKPFDTLADLGNYENTRGNVGKLKLFEDSYGIDMEKDPMYPLLVGQGFLATASAIIYCKKAKITVGEEITRLIFGVKEISLGHEEIARDVQLNPFKDVLVFKKMVEYVGAIPINFKGNIWESEDMIDKKIDLNKPPKERDGVWHIRIEIIDPDG